MSEADKLAFQAQIVRQMKARRRRAFGGPMVLQLSASTTEKTPAHAQTIAKNLLDLLAQPLNGLATSRKGILYQDDSQVHAVSVSCSHGTAAPKISLIATSFGDFWEDLDLAMHALSQLDKNDSDCHERRDDAALDRLAKLLRYQAEQRALLADRNHAAFLDFARSEAQRQLLGKAGLSVQDLGYLYNARGGPICSNSRSLASDTSAIWESVFHQTPFRVLLAELPQREGASIAYRQDIEAKIRHFQDRYSWVLKPLRIPVTLEVVIKPPPPSRARGVHDLDNVLREYLIPRVIEIFEPPSDIAWTIDVNALRTHKPDLYAGWRERLQRLPASTRIGLTGYEAWRLQRSESDESRGFVSVAIVPDTTGMADTLSRIDAIISRWDRRMDR